MLPGAIQTASADDDARASSVEIEFKHRETMRTDRHSHANVYEYRVPK